MSSAACQVVKGLLYTHPETDKLRALDGDPESFEVSLIPQQIWTQDPGS